MTTPVPQSTADEWLFGWDPTPGIVSVWASRDGRATVWQRQPGADRVTATSVRFRPWLFATSLADVEHLGPALSTEPDAPISYIELAGPPDSYRFLLSARNGRTLEQAVLKGAAQRLGQMPRNLYGAGDGYYWVGPVEQYLMQTGRTCFRGLTYADLHRLQFDLETTALSPSEGRIFLIAVRDSRGLATVLEAPTAADEPALIAELCALIRERDPDVIENHNLGGFDLPFLYARAQHHRIPLRLGRPGGPALVERFTEPGGRGGSLSQRRRRERFSIAGRELIDTLDAVWRHDFTVRTMNGYGLKAAARHFGVAAPERTYIPGSAIFSTYASNPELVRRYALDDVQEVDGLSQRLLGAAFALTGMAPRRYGRVASAGTAMGILEPMLVRAYLRAGAALPPPHPNRNTDQGPHTGGATYLFAAGVAQQIVKADIASMYPSIMRSFQIGPACDRLTVLRTLVERLTDLRLEHKDAARAAQPGSISAHEHEALQAAMKLMINSAYGYMGAERMALFADRQAADAVTSTGRAILDQVVAALRERGMALLEADTDGVYFAAPLGWSEAQERAVVAEVAALLPPGLRLEYEGRYQAMLSHEVKNYALLTYDGELIVRGVAMRSSRAEPFGERFLQEALPYLLRGDIPNLQRVYHQTVQALRSRTIPIAAVATRARLTKAPDEYMKTRARLREAPYEALLNVGRSTWATGERIWFYRDLHGRFVWLPTEQDEASEADSGDSARSAAHALPDYDSEHYIQVLHTSFISRLRKAFAPEDFEQLLRQEGQQSLFDRPLGAIAPRWIRADEPEHIH